MKDLSSFITESTIDDIEKAIPFELVCLDHKSEYKIIGVEQMPKNKRLIGLFAEGYPNITLISNVNDTMKLIKGVIKEIIILECGYERPFELK